MPIQRVIVCEAQVPFVRGGAERHVRSLVDQLQRRGYEAELVSLPFKWYPRREVLTHAAAWRLIDLSESNGRPIDLVIGSKFPSYFVRHPNKVVWLIHQHREAYDLCGTIYSDFAHVEEDVGLRETLLRLDREMLGECRRVFTNARNTADRLAAFNGMASEPLYHPPPLAERLTGGSYGDYALFVGRIESIKRPDLAVEAMRHIQRPIRLIVVGEGTRREPVEALTHSLGIADRVEFRGAVSDDELVALYRDALCVIYTPYDEDFGYVTLESFLAAKPVITSPDSGGPLEFVEHGVNGMVCPPHAEAIAAAVNELAQHRQRAAALGAAGAERARTISWDDVIDKLLN
ncbi:MAG: glycosyltransferase family 4 protein [Vicinamibacterales bacterium]